jgi:CDP-paratose 2-epimerase
MRLLVTGICGFVGSTAWRTRPRLSYIGFGGSGFQVRDALHPRDLAALVAGQLADSDFGETGRIWNIGGGLTNSMSLAEVLAKKILRNGIKRALCRS